MKKKGFTLIELMIVLAIIAILAVVIIPKSSIFKKNAKTAGVTTNMNTVRAYLETKTGDNFLSTAAKLQPVMDKNFKGNEVIKNPKSDGSGIVATTMEDDTSVFIIAGTADPTIPEDDIDNYKGVVIVVVDGTNYDYTVYGVDLDGNLLGSKYTIEK